MLWLAYLFFQIDPSINMCLDFFRSEGSDIIVELYAFDLLYIQVFIWPDIVFI